MENVYRELERKLVELRNLDDVFNFIIDELCEAYEVRTAVIVSIDVLSLNFRFERIRGIDSDDEKVLEETFVSPIIDELKKRFEAAETEDTIFERFRIVKNYEEPRPSWVDVFKSFFVTEREGELLYLLFGGVPERSKTDFEGLLNISHVSLRSAFLAEALMKKITLEKELKIAAKMQSSLLPNSLPNDEKLETAALCRPALKVGGDIYDVGLTKSSRLFLFIADAIGKGITATLPAVYLHSAYRLLLYREFRPRQILGRLNRHIIRNMESRTLITTCIAVLSRERTKVRFSCAGHLPPMLIRNDTAREIGVEGLPLGWRIEAQYKERQLTLKSGDILSLYSDGVLDSLAEKEGEDGAGKLAEIIIKYSNLSLDQIIEKIKYAAFHIGPTTPMDDDFTLILLRKK